MRKWYIEKGDQGDVVLSTRVRLARNLDDHPFPARLAPQEKKKVCETVRDALCGNDFHYTEMTALTHTQAVSLAERHLISPEFTGSPEGRALMLTEDESVSIMLCEEDHIRLQVMQAGLALREAYDIANKIDDLLSTKLPIAFDERIGFLTQCPTNLGTGMRASVMLHLPALTRSGKLSALAATVSKLGLVLRGAYGEGSKASGDIYQLSNQITLGITEEAAIDNLQAITLQIIAQERQIAAEMLKDPREEDRVWRALGVLATARLLSGEEFMELISPVRMGAARGIFDLPLESVNELIVQMQPATINAAQETPLSPAERDRYRAEQVRNVFHELVF